MRHSRRTLGLALGVAAGLCASPAAGSPRSYLIPFCIDELMLIPVRVAQIPIPVGCELIDCCPGCPGTGPIDWRVRVGGPALTSVAIEFEGLSTTSTLAVEGDGEPIAHGAVIGPKGATLRNLRGEGERVPVATLRLRLDAAAVARLRKGMSGAGGDTLMIAIDQMLGPVPVNEFRLEIMLRPCRQMPVGACEDRVVQQGNRMGDASVVLLDGRRSGGCSNDELFRTDAAVDVDNVLAPANCQSELAIFSEGDAMRLSAPETTWTDACGDVALAPLDPPLAAPVSVWLAWPSLPPLPGPDGKAKADFANANLIYDQNKTGIQFSAQMHDLSGDSGARDAILKGCLAVRSLPSRVYTPKQLNVYYTPMPITGENCEDDHNAVYVGSIANLATLAHELGHALSLFGANITGGHVNQLPGFTEENVMWGGGKETRDLLSLGQAFRFNVDARSFLNVNGVRSGPTRTCPALVASDACPKLDLDWARP